MAPIFHNFGHPPTSYPNSPTQRDPFAPPKTIAVNDRIRWLRKVALLRPKNSRAANLFMLYSDSGPVSSLSPSQRDARTRTPRGHKCGPWPRYIGSTSASVMRVGVVLRRGAVLAQHFGLVALQNHIHIQTGSIEGNAGPACWLVGMYRYKYTLQLLMLSMM